MSYITILSAQISEAMAPLFMDTWSRYWLSVIPNLLGLTCSHSEDKEEKLRGYN
jgi:hypothetical protein